MALRFTPHNVVIQSVSANKGTNKLNNALTYSAPGVIVKGQISATDPTSTFNTWGIETIRPHNLLLNLEDADGAGIKLGDKITWGARSFLVKTAPRRSEHGLVTDHALVLMEEIG